MRVIPRLHNYQKAFLRDKSKFRLWVKSRKVGGSWLLALDAVCDASRGIPTAFISRSTPQSVILLNHFYKWCEYLNAVSDEQFVFTKRNETSCTVNGVSVLALSHNPDTFQGFEGNVKLDEFSLQDRDDEVFANAMPIATLGYRVDMIGRAAGKGNRFYEVWADTLKYPEFSRHKTTIYDAIAGGLVAKDGAPINVDAIRRTLTEDEFREQYLCEFIDESYAFMPYELIKSCVDYDNIIPRVKHEEVYYGYDVARSNKGDNAVLAGLAREGEKKYLVVLNAVKGETFEAQVSYVSGHAAKQGTRQVLIDATGMGKMPAEQLRAKHYNVQAVDFTNQLKAEMAQKLKIAFERREIVIPDDDDLISDIHSIQKEYTGANNVRYDAPRTAAGHGDRFWALAMANHASDVGSFEMVFV